MSTVFTYQEKLSQLKAELGETNLIAVSKYTTDEEVLKCYEAGQRDFGESKVQDLLRRSEEFKDLDGIQWHFIGRLQKNKINHLFRVKNLKTIQSVDSLELYEAMHLRSQALQEEVEIFLQVNTSFEDEKGGFRESDALEELVSKVATLKNDKLHFVGLMTIGSIRSVDFEKSARESFAHLVNLKKKFDAQYDLSLKLSMGMSSDYHIAVEYASSYVRIGSSLFSES